MTTPRILVRAPGDAFRQALSSHADRAAIDPARAVGQHRAFVAALRATGADVVELPADPALADACFVSDCVLAFPSADEPAGPTRLLVVTRPGAPSRRPEVATVAARARALAPDAE